MSEWYRDRRQPWRIVQAMRWEGQRTAEWPDWAFEHFPIIRIDRAADALVVPTATGDKPAALGAWVVLEPGQGLAVLEAPHFAAAFEPTR